MNAITYNCGQSQFANCQISRDSQVNPDDTKPESALEVNATERGRGAEPEEFPAPIGKLLGLKILESSNGVAVLEFVADERYANPMGTLHGGVLCDLADAAMGFAYYNTLAAGESFTTLELKLNFLRPVWKATLCAKARVVRGGRFVGLVECDVIDEQERLVARASSTCLTLRGELAEGRRPAELPTQASRA